MSGQLMVINAKNQVATWPQQMLGSMVSFSPSDNDSYGP